MLADRSLTNRRILVTRSEEQASPLCDALLRVGAVPVRFPTIRTRAVSIDDGFAHLHAADWLVFTSPNGVGYYFDARNKPSLPPNVRVAAVGSTTTSALRERGVDVALVPDVFDGRHLADAFDATAKTRFVLVQPAEARPELADTLEARGGTVTRIVAYRTETAPRNPRAAAALAEGIDAVTFTSPSTVRGLVELVAPDERVALAGAVVVCIGPVTAGEARRCGFQVDAIANQRTTEGLLNALAQCFEQIGAAS